MNELNCPHAAAEADRRLVVSRAHVPAAAISGALVGYVRETRTGRVWRVRRDGRRWVVTLQWGARHSFAYATRDLSLGAVETVVRRMLKTAPR